MNQAHLLSDTTLQPTLPFVGLFHTKFDPKVARSHCHTSLSVWNSTVRCLISLLIVSSLLKLNLVHTDVTLRAHRLQIEIRFLQLLSLD